MLFNFTDSLIITSCYSCNSSGPKYLYIHLSAYIYVVLPNKIYWNFTQFIMPLVVLPKSHSCVAPVVLCDKFNLQIGLPPNKLSVFQWLLHLSSIPTFPQGQSRGSNHESFWLFKITSFTSLQRFIIAY